MYENMFSKKHLRIHMFVYIMYENMYSQILRSFLLHGNHAWGAPSLRTILISSTRRKKLVQKYANPVVKGLRLYR